MIKKILTILSASAIMLLPLINVSPAGAQNASDVCKGVGIASGGNQQCDPAKGNKVTDAIKMGIRLFEIVIGVIAVFMIIVAGLRFITSSGDSGKIASARNTILYAIIGLVVVALAEVIVQFVLNRLPK